VKLTTRKIAYGTESQNCRNCGHPFKGRVCNMCGEKVFDGKHLSAKHFFHEVIDFFYHFENKVLKTIKLNFLKPGFVTKENLNGVRVPYAKPIQLYLVVAFLFYIIVSKVRVTDYIPNYGDHNYYQLSDYKLLKWTKSADEWAVNTIDSMWIQKGRDMEKRIAADYAEYFIKRDELVLGGRGNKDSVVLSPDKLPVIAFRDMAQVRWVLFDAKVGTFGKTLIFILLPFFAAVFFLIFFKKIKHYGASLILATHFMVYNLCVYSLNALISTAPQYIDKSLKNWLMRPVNFIFYNDNVEPVSTILFGGSFEFFHLLFWMPWMFIAFKRLFNTPWWQNLLISFVCSRVFFYLIFGVLKKIVIAFTIWTLHI
jgi:Protein of unknown function (DUF3667)